MHYGQACVELAQTMIRSAREHMPGVVCVQVTDMRTPQIPGVDEVIRVRGAKYVKLQCDGMAQVPEPFIRVDTDMVFQADLRSVFDIPGEWTVAGCGHGDPKMLETEFGRQYRYSGAVAAFRNGGAAEYFGRIWARHVQAERDDWMGVVLTANEIAEDMAADGKLAILDGYTWNYSPTTREDRPVDAKVLHYKGSRKRWLTPESAAFTEMVEKRVYAFGRRREFVRSSTDSIQ